MVYTLRKGFYGMEIKQCTPDDAQALAIVVATTWQTAYDDVLPPSVLDADSTRLRIEHLGYFYANGLQNSWFEGFFIVENSANIGCFMTGHSRDADADLSVAEILGIYIIGGYRHQGFGTQALAFIEDRLRLQGYKRVTLWVLEDNERPIRFYRKHGYQPDGALRSAVLGNSIVELRFAKTL